MPWVVRVSRRDSGRIAQHPVRSDLVIGLLIYTSGMAVVARRKPRTVEWARHQMACKEDLRESERLGP
jgi:hypothetical protein